MPATNGSRISRSTQSTSRPTSSVSTQNVIWRVSVIALSLASVRPRW